jgi:hypothetical protein
MQRHCFISYFYLLFLRLSVCLLLGLVLSFLFSFSTVKSTITTSLFHYPLSRFIRNDLRTWLTYHAKFPFTGTCLHTTAHIYVLLLEWHNYKHRISIHHSKRLLQIYAMIRLKVIIIIEHSRKARQSTALINKCQQRFNWKTTKQTIT